MSQSVGRPRTETDRQEAVRQRIVWLVSIVFLLLVFEGVLRKWLFPEFHRPLYFVRDPFVAAIYIYAFAYGFIERSPILTALGVFAVFVAIFHLALVLAGVGHPISWAIGVRHYFFYVPLAFIIGYCFRFEDLANLVRLNLLLAIPIAILVFYQYQAPPSAWINRGLSDDIESITLVVDGMVRPYGTFTYTSGHVLYTAASVAMLAAGWLMRRELRLPLWLLLAGGAAIVVMALTTGSRTIWFYSAAIACCLAVGTLSGGRLGQSASALIFVALAALAAIVLYRSVLAPAYQAILVRAEVAEQSEPLIERALNMFAVALETATAAPIQGFGLGSGILAAVAALTGERAFVLAEVEWQRNVLELGPIFGLCFIALRISVGVWLLRRGLLASRASGNVMGLLLLGFAGPLLVVGELTNSGTGATFGWLFAGFALAATNLERPEQGKAVVAAGHRAGWSAAAPPAFRPKPRGMLQPKPARLPIWRRDRPES